jgi:hypothetical protein
MPAEIANTITSGARMNSHFSGGAGLVGGHRGHVDAERRKAGDGQADAHVVVDAQHVGAQTGIDGRGINAPGGPAERRYVVTV